MGLKGRPVGHIDGHREQRLQIAGQGDVFIDAKIGGRINLDQHVQIAIRVVLPSRGGAKQGRPRDAQAAQFVAMTFQNRYDGVAFHFGSLSQIDHTSIPMASRVYQTRSSAA